MEKIIYLDTNIFISTYLKREGYKKIIKFFDEAKDSEAEFVTSDWTLTEIVRVLTNEYKIGAKKVANYIQEIQREKRIGKIKFNFVGVGDDKDYDFEEFFFHLQKILLQYKSSIADAIHSLIMKNNGIKNILTTDSDFNGMKGIITINPLDN